MLESPTGGPTPPAGPQDDDDRDEVAAAAPLVAVRALVSELDLAADRACGGSGDATSRWEVLVAALQSRAVELAGHDGATWRLAVGSAVPLDRWLCGAWAAWLRTALLADGFGPAGADQALGVVAVHLQRTCPAGVAGADGAGALSAYPVLSRLRPQLSADAPEVAPVSSGGLLARLAALRG